MSEFLFLRNNPFLLLEKQLELLTGDLSDGTNLPKSRIPTPVTEPAGTGAA